MNIKYTKIKNNIVYTTAALGILHNIETNKQKYFPYHHEDIVSLALHPNGYTVATGQMAQKGSSRSIDLFIWNIKSLPNETNINTEFRENVPEDVYNLKGVLQCLSLLIILLSSFSFLLGVLLKIFVVTFFGL